MSSSAARHSSHAAKDNGAHKAKDSAAGNGHGHGDHAPAAFLLRPVAAALEGWRGFAAVGAENMEDHMHLLEAGWRDLSACRTPLDFSRAAGRFSLAYSQFVGSAGQRVAGFVGDCVSRHAATHHDETAH